MWAWLVSSSSSTLPVLPCEEGLSHNLHQARRFPPVQGEQLDTPRHPFRGAPSVGAGLQVKVSLSPRSSLGLSGGGPCHPADRSGRPDVPSHLLRLYRIPPREHLPPADSESSKAPQGRLACPSSLCSLVPSKRELSAPQRRAQRWVAQHPARRVATSVTLC